MGRESVPGWLGGTPRSKPPFFVAVLVRPRRNKWIDARRSQRRPDARNNYDGTLGKRDCEVDQRVQDVHADEHRLSEPHGDRSAAQTSDEPRRQEPRAPFSFQQEEYQMLSAVPPTRYGYTKLPHTSAHRVDDGAPQRPTVAKTIARAPQKEIENVQLSIRNGHS